MKKINMKILVVTSFACLLPILLGVLFYSKLPESIAIHWGVQNNPNGYFSKPAFVFGMPIIMLVLQLFCCIVSDLSDKNPEANKKAVTVYKWMIPILTIVLYIITIIYALGSHLDIRKIVMVILGVLFIISGNYMPKLRGDYYMNMKVFWIKNRNEEFVNQAAKKCGYALMIGGIACLLSIAFKSIVSIMVIGAIILYTLYIYIAVYLKSRKAENDGE